MSAIASLHPAIEVIEPRYTDWLAVGIHSVIADLGGNGAIVLGTAVPAWRRIDLREASVRMTLNGKIVGQGTGADCMGDPVAALWLPNVVVGTIAVHFYRQALREIPLRFPRLFESAAVSAGRMAETLRARARN